MAGHEIRGMTDEAGCSGLESLEQKKKRVETITRLSVEILGGQPDSVDILTTDIKCENCSTGGQLLV